MKAFAYITAVTVLVLAEVVSAQVVHEGSITWPIDTLTKEKYDKQPVINLRSDAVPISLAKAFDILRCGLVEAGVSEYNIFSVQLVTGYINGNGNGIFYYTFNIMSRPSGKKESESYDAAVLMTGDFFLRRRAVIKK